jgi:hypothetical protein
VQTSLALGRCLQVVRLLEENEAVNRSYVRRSTWIDTDIWHIEYSNSLP